MPDLHDKVRSRAFEIWQAEGRPEGRDLDHWLRAEAEIMAQPASKATPAESRRHPTKSPARAAAKPIRSKAGKVVAGE